MSSIALKSKRYRLRGGRAVRDDAKRSQSAFVKGRLFSVPPIRCRMLC